MINQLKKTLLFLILLSISQIIVAQCPSFTSNTTLIGCTGTPNCAVCPGDNIGVSVTGTNFPSSGCVDFYYSTSPVFNPPLQGTFMGCAPTVGTQVTPCSPCPTVFGTMIDACGNPEAANEFLVMGSGGGFTVGDLSIDFDTPNNGGLGNDDIGSGCGWQNPNPGLVAAISSACAGGNVIALGPGSQVPPQAIVLAFTSSATNYFSYDFSTICGITGITVCIIQSSCERTKGAFSNAATLSPGSRTHSVSLSCGCSSSQTYATSALSGNDGDFLVHSPAPFPPLYLNLPCGAPIPAPPVTPPPPSSETVNINWSVPATLCNGGPYYVTGVVNPLNAGCPPVQTSTVQFDVVCPTPTITPVPLCSSSTPFDLNTLLDQSYIGTWSSTSNPSAVAPNGSLNTSSITGNITVRFEPTPCGTPTSAVLNIASGPSALIDPIQPLCAGTSTSLELTFTGTAPYTFDLLANNALVNSYTSPSNTFSIPITVNANTSYEIVNLASGSCTGTGAQVTVNTQAAPTGTLSSGGNTTVCAGEATTLEINFTGTAPWTFEYNAGANPQVPITTNDNPYILSISPTTTTTYSLTAVSAGSCTGTFSGSETITVSPEPTATVQPNLSTICEGQNADVTIDFTGNGPWTFDYTISGAPAGTETANVTPYTLNLSPSAGTNTISISSLSTASGSCAGTFSGSATINVAPTPTASIGGNEVICSGGLATIQVDFTGTGAYTFEYSDGGAAQSITTSDNPFFLNVSPSTTTTYTLTSLTTPNCPGTVSGSYTVTVASNLTATIQSGSTTTCVGTTVAVPITFSGTAPFTFEYAIGGTSAGTITTNQNNYTLMLTPSLGNSTISLLAVTDAGGCPGTVAGQYDITVGAQPTAVLSGSETLCGPGTANFMIDFTGNAPYTLEYSDGGTTQSITTSDNPYTLSVTASAPNTYTLVALDADGCTGVVSGQAEVQFSTFTATMSGDQNYCLGSGAGADLLIEFTGQAPPYLISYRENGVIQPPVNVTTNPYTLTVFPSVGTTYTLNSVSTPSCTGTASGLAEVLVFLPSTADVMSTNTDFCAAQITNVEIDFTGTGPFILYYSLNGAPQTPITTNDDPYFLPLNITQNTNFALDSIRSTGCLGNVLNGGVNYRVIPDLFFTNFDIACNQGAGTYTVASTLVDGTPPYVLLQGNGSFSGDDFLSDPIALNTDYSIWITDASNCDTIRLEGTPNCSCTTDAGTMDATLIESCENAAAVSAIFNQDSTLDANDAFVFVLHTSPGGTLGTVLSTSQSPSFPFIPGQTDTDVTYYISPIAGDTSGMGTILISDPCFSIGAGTPVLWRSAPSANVLTADRPVCAGEMTSVEIEFTGNPPFIVDYSVNGVPQPSIATSDNPYFLPLTINQTLNFVLDSVRADICLGAILDDAVNFTVLPTLTTTNFTLDCNQSNSSYSITFTAIAGIPPYTVVQSAGSFVGNQFSAAAIPLSDPYSIWITDGSTCDTLRFEGIANCACTTDAGTMDATLLESCTNNAAITALFNQDATLDAEDALEFILFSDNSSPISSILATNDTPSFQFLTASMSPDITYYIASIAGDSTALGSVNTSDPCLSVGTSTPVIWRSAPSANVLTVDRTFCEAQNTTVEIEFTGIPPYTLDYTLNTVAQASIVTSDNPYFLPLTINQNTTLTLDSVRNDLCAGTLQNTTVTFSILPTLFYTDFDVVCDQTAGTYTVTCSMTGGTAPYALVQGLGSFAGDDFTSDPIALNTPYSIWITDANMCDTIRLEGTANCSCTTNAGTMDVTPIDACVDGTVVMATFNQDSTIDAEDVFYYVLHTNSGNILGTILATSPSPAFQFLSGLTAPEQTYYISPIAGDSTALGLVNTNDPCFSVGIGTPVVWHDLPTVTMSGDFNTCAGESQVIPISFTGNAPFSYTYAQGNDTLAPPPVNSGNSTAINVTLNQDETFVPISISDAHCAGTVNGMATVDVHPEPEITNVDISCDAVSQTYIVEFDVNHDSLSSVTITGSLGGDYDTLTGHFTSAPVPWTNSYSAVVADLVWNCGLDSISGMPNCACTTDAGTMSQTPISLCFQDTAMVAAAVGATLEANDTLLYILSPDPGPPTWTTLQANSEPTFSFIQGAMNTGQTYYILAVAGDTASTPSGIDLGDPCLSVASGTPVSWREPITAAMQDNLQICQGDTASLSIVFGGVGPFTLDYLENAVPQAPLTSTTDTFTLLVHPNLSANYSPINVTGGGCAGTVSGGAAVSVLLPPDLLDVEQRCDFVAGTYQVSFNITNGAAPNPTYTVTGLAGTLLDTTFLSDPIPVSQGFSLVVSNPTGCSTTLSGVSQCACATSAGSIENGPFGACSSDLIQFAHLGDFALDTNDVLQYIVFEDSTLLPAGILMTLAAPEIQFDASLLSLGQTYFVAAIAGNDDGSGSIDLADPCLSISAMQAFSFFQEPSATLMGDTMVCPNSDVVFEILLTGTAPYELSYTQNGGFPITLTSNTDVFAVSYNDITLDQNISLVSIRDSAGCQGTAVGTAMITVRDVPEAFISGDTTVCLGGTVDLTLNLLNGTTFDVELSDGVNPPIQYFGITTGEVFSVTPTQSISYEITGLTATGADCPAMIGNTFTLNVAPMDITANVSQYGGFQISCSGAADGTIEWIPQGGDPTLGYTYLWNTGDSTQFLSGLDTGLYVVTVSDQAFCESVDSVYLEAPQSILLDWDAANPACSGTDVGSILLESIFGGSAPYTVDIDPSIPTMSTGLPFFWENINPDTYSLQVTDANGCTASDVVQIFEPNGLAVDLGDSLINVLYGDSVHLEAMVNYGPLLSVDWASPGTVAAADSLTLDLVPFQTTSVIVTVEDTSGCVTSDRVVITVERKNRVYIPTIFQPYSNTGNGILHAYGGPEVERIEQFDIYDRWGNMVYQASDYAPNDLRRGWDGTFGNREVQPGVFVYVVRVRYIDGTTEVIKGDVTVAY